jgi:UDP-N-acetylglucosamine 2-epimerase (non-hydrolysing)
MKTIVHVVGARPNYMKIAPLMRALSVVPVCQCLVNTGQHYDDQLAGAVMRDLALPSPDWNLAVGSGTHAAQTARVMMAFEQVCGTVKPDLVVVVGDVNSTMAATLVSAKLSIPVAHIESGLRSFDRTMPEEINRVVTDQLSELLFTPSPDADENLRREGIAQHRIHRVGNIMVDSLLETLPDARFDRLADHISFAPKTYGVLTLHRPSNVDDPDTFRSILDAVETISRQIPIVFPVHPRTRQRLAQFNLNSRSNRLVLTDPFGYVDFLALVAHARVILTDSGGLQEESTVLRIPCLTLRDNTERPITITSGTNRLVGTDARAIVEGFEAIGTAPVNGRIPELWDGQTAPRIARTLAGFLGA